MRREGIGVDLYCRGPRKDLETGAQTWANLRGWRCSEHAGAYTVPSASRERGTQAPPKRPKSVTLWTAAATRLARARDWGRPSSQCLAGRTALEAGRALAHPAVRLPASLPDPRPPCSLRRHPLIFLLTRGRSAHAKTCQAALRLWQMRPRRKSIASGAFRAPQNTWPAPPPLTSAFDA